MILIALGSNITSAEFKTSQDLLESSLNRLENIDIRVIRRSSWYRSAPVPASDQPWFVNGVAEVETSLPPEDLLKALHAVESEYGRVRFQRNDSRTLDLDLLAYGNKVSNETDGLILPHPRLQERAFVLLPLAEVAPQWRHPITGMTPAEMLSHLPPDQEVVRIPQSD